MNGEGVPQRKREYADCGLYILQQLLMSSSVLLLLVSASRLCCICHVFGSIAWSLGGRWISWFCNSVWSFVGMHVMMCMEHGI